MNERAPVPENLPVAPLETEPRLEQALAHIDQENAVLPEALAARSRAREDDPTLWQRGSRFVKGRVLASTLALLTVAGAESVAAKPAEAGGHTGRKIARVGAVILGETGRALEDSYHYNMESIRNLEQAWERNQREQDRIVRDYEMIAQQINGANQQIAFEEKNFGDTRGLRNQLEYREILRGQQEDKRRELRREVAFQHALEERMGGRMQAAEHGGRQKRDIGRVLQVGSRVLEILGSRY